jgi:two-component system, NarL family, invasion response regulator UvrY
MEEARLAGDTQRRENVPLRILIGENNSDLAMTLNLLLDAEPDMRCVSTVSSGKAVLQAVEEHAPNAFILDLSLDDGSSLPLLGTLRQRLPAAAIVVFTGHKNELLNEQCMRAGANSVVVKTGEFEELTAALRNAARIGWAPPGPKRADG